MNKDSSLYKTYVDGIDCSEIADDLFEAAGGKGKIYDITPNQGTLNVEEYGSVQGFDYHTVYSDGTCIYDPRHSSTPVLESTCFELLKKLNPGGFKLN